MIYFPYASPASLSPFIEHFVQARRYGISPVKDTRQAPAFMTLVLKPALTEPRDELATADEDGIGAKGSICVLKENHGF